MKCWVLNGVAHFILITNNQRPFDFRRHPDFYAADFISCALTYLALKRNPVHTCHGTWFKSSVNAHQFWSNLNNGFSPVEAAKNTWFGRQFMKNGFEHITLADVQIKFQGINPIVEADFHKF